MSRAAVIQMNSTPDVAENLANARRLLEHAAATGAKLAVLPENFAIMGLSDRDKLAVAEPFSPSLDKGPIQVWLARAARELDLWVVAGTAPIKVENEPRVAAACLVVDARGACVARYDKIHLFDVDVPASADRPAENYRESATITPGATRTVIDTPIGKLGLAICYDVRFPELFRALAMQGAEVFCLPSAFTVPTGRAHWHVLLRARAVENLCYMLAAAQSGRHANGRETYGHSMVVGPWGEVLTELPAGAGLVTADIDVQQSAELRRRFPVLQHRRI